MICNCRIVISSSPMRASSLTMCAICILLVVNAHINGDADIAYQRAVEKIDDLIAQLQAPETRPLGLAPHGRASRQKYAPMSLPAAS